MPGRGDDRVAGSDSGTTTPLKRDAAEDGREEGEVGGVPRQGIRRRQQEHGEAGAVDASAVRWS